jgi:hypothetical protein
MVRHCKESECTAVTSTGVPILYGPAKSEATSIL